MTIQTPHATTFAKARRAPAEPPPSILTWMVEALVLGPDRLPPPEEDTPREEALSLRADAPRRAALHDTIPAWRGERRSGRRTVYAVQWTVRRNER